MHFCQTAQYTRNPFEFSLDDRQGASVAHAEFLRAMLTHARPESTTLLYRQESDIRSSEGGFQELNREFPTRIINRRPLTDLSKVVSAPSTVLYSSGVFIAPIAMHRSANGLTYPLCTLTHSLDVSAVLFFLPGAALWAGPQDVFIASSEAGKTTLLRLQEESFEFMKSYVGATRLPRGARIETIPLGVDAGVLRPLDQKECRVTLGLPPDQFVVLYSGRLNQDTKADLEPLLIAFRRLTEECGNCLLVCAGQDNAGEYSREVMKLATEMQLGERVRIIRNYAHVMKPWVYGCADVVVLPVDNVQETFGMAAVEAMSCGKPVIASAWSGLKEIVRDGETGFLVKTFWSDEYADSEIDVFGQLLTEAQRRRKLAERTIVDVDSLYRRLLLLRQQPDLCLTLGQRGRQIVIDKYCWPVVIKMHSRLWDDLSDAQKVSEGGRMPAWMESPSRLYGHYASHKLRPGFRLRASRYSWQAGTQRIAELPPALKSVYRVCQDADASLADLDRESGTSAVIAALWMLKKGLLEPSMNNSESHLIASDLQPEVEMRIKEA